MPLKILQTLGMDVLANTGSPIRVMEISRSLTRKGCSVHATSFSIQEKRALEQNVDGVRVSRIPFLDVRTEEARIIANTPRLLKLNTRIIREHGIDIIHSHLFSATLTSFLLKKRFGIPYIYDMHSLFPDERITDSPGFLQRTRLFPWKPIENRLRSNADYIVATSDTMRNYLVKEGYKKVESVPVGVDTDVFRPGSPSQEIIKRHHLEGKKVVVYTGNTNPYQGLGDIIESIPGVAKEDRGIIFLIVGGGQELEGYRKRAIELGVSNSVIFTGPQPYSSMPSYLSVADLCLSMRASTFTGNMTFPTKLTTYMAAGKPSICTRTGDQESILSMHDIGSLVDSGRPAQLAEAILGSLSDQKGLKKQGRNAREAAVKEFSWDVLCERYERIYKLL